MSIRGGLTRTHPHVRCRRTEDSRMLITGSCHCRNISFALTWEPEPSEIPARACTCSFCTKHGGVWASCPTGSLEVTVKDPSIVSKYTFGTKTARTSAPNVAPCRSSRLESAAVSTLWLASTRSKVSSHRFFGGCRRRSKEKAKKLAWRGAHAIGSPRSNMLKATPES
jgi:hypothetical protein